MMALRNSLKFCRLPLLHAEVSCLHLPVVCEFRAGAVHDHTTALQHVGSLHQSQCATHILLDQQNRRAHGMNFPDFLKGDIGHDWGKP